MREGRPHRGSEESAETDEAADEIVKELQELRKAIPLLIFLIRLAQARARRKREAEAVDLALTGSQADEAGDAKSSLRTTTGFSIARGTRSRRPTS